MFGSKHHVCIKLCRQMYNLVQSNEVFSHNMSRSGTIAQQRNISTEIKDLLNDSSAPPSVDDSTSSSTNTNSGPNSTCSRSEIEKFRILSNEWWKPLGEFSVLHSLNQLRVPLIRDGLTEMGLATPPGSLGPQPLESLRILDVGCGGGILSEPLARLGATVTGLDACAEGIQVAKLHAERDARIHGSINYVCGTLEDHVLGLEQQYDAIVASELIEHVASVPAFLSACDAALRPGGSLFITTINRTAVSFLGAIVMAEWVTGIVPKGTHEWGKFVPPQEVQDHLARNGMRTHLVHGMVYCPISNRWHWSRDTAINYALHAAKPAAAA